MRSYVRHLVKTGRWTIVFVALVTFWVVKG
jgi:hypothetical protein